MVNPSYEAISAIQEKAKRIIFEYIEVFYNRIRRHAKKATKFLLISSFSITLAIKLQHNSDDLLVQKIRPSSVKPDFKEGEKHVGRDCDWVGHRWHDGCRSAGRRCWQEGARAGEALGARRAHTCLPP